MPHLLSIPLMVAGGAFTSLIFSAVEGNLFATQDMLPRLKLSENHRFLARDGGAPFFYTVIGTYDNTGEREVVPPNPGELLDWILVLDDDSKEYPMPGKSKGQP